MEVKNIHVDTRVISRRPACHRAIKGALKCIKSSGMNKGGLKHIVKMSSVKVIGTNIDVPVSASVWLSE